MNWAEVINETLRYLEKNIMTVQGPKEVAMEVHVSSSYLQNSFQMITGYTIGEYIRRRRLYLAAMDLIEKDENSRRSISMTFRSKTATKKPVNTKSTGLVY